MRAGVFIPCYMDACKPEVGIAALELIDRLGCEANYPFGLACCGQPMTNIVRHEEAADVEALFVRNTPRFDDVAVPAGSCVRYRNKKPVGEVMGKVAANDQIRPALSRPFGQSVD